MSKIKSIVTEAVWRANTFAPGDPAVTESGMAFGKQLAAEVLQWEDEARQQHDDQTRGDLPTALKRERDTHPDDRVREFLDAAVTSYRRHLDGAVAPVRGALDE